MGALAPNVESDSRHHTLGKILRRHFINLYFPAFMHSLFDAKYFFKAVASDCAIEPYN